MATFSAKPKSKACSARWIGARRGASARPPASGSRRRATREKIAPYDFKRPERVGKEQMRALANAARGFRPQFRRGALGPAADHRRSEAHQRRSAHLQRIRLQPGKPDLLQSAQGRAARRQSDSRHQSVDPLSDHRPAAGRRQRDGHASVAAAADRNRTAARVADHRSVSGTRCSTPGKTCSS